MQYLFCPYILFPENPRQSEEVSEITILFTPKSFFQAAMVFSTITGLVTVVLTLSFLAATDCSILPEEAWQTMPFVDLEIPSSLEGPIGDPPWIEDLLLESPAHKRHVTHLELPSKDLNPAKRPISTTSPQRTSRRFFRGVLKEPTRILRWG